MSKQVSDYTALITSAHTNQPNFMAMIAACVSTSAQIQAIYDSFITLFDVDTAVGDQLKTIGLWVGITNVIAIPITGIFFSWDETAPEGWDSGVWRDLNNSGASLNILPDPFFRTLIKAKIAANHWDGTTEGAYVIWDILFSTLNLLIQDNQDMSISIGVQGTGLDPLTQALLIGGYLPLKPEGVRIVEYFVPTDSNPFFAWDTDTAYLNGWDVGSWAKELAST